MDVALCVLGLVAGAWALCARGTRAAAHRDRDVLEPVDELGVDVIGWETPAGAGGEVADLDPGQFGHLPPVYDRSLPIVRVSAPPRWADAGASPYDDWCEVA